MLHKKHMFCLPVVTGHYDFNVGNYYYKILKILYICFCSALRSPLHWQFKWPLGGAMYTSEKPAGVIVRGCLWLVVSHHMTETGSWWRQRTTKMAAIGSSNYWEGTAAKFLLFVFTGFAVTLITGVIMCKVKLKGFSAAFKSVWTQHERHVYSRIRLANLIKPY